METQDEARQRIPLSGYPRLAEEMSDGYAMIFRRYSTISMLNVLRLQAELQDMERSLCDKISKDGCSANPKIRGYRDDFRAMRCAKQQSAKLRARSQTVDGDPLRAEEEQGSEPAQPRDQGQDSRRDGVDQQPPNADEGIDLIVDIGLKLQEYSKSPAWHQTKPLLTADLVDSRGTRVSVEAFQVRKAHQVRNQLRARMAAPRRPRWEFPQWHREDHMGGREQRRFDHTASAESRERHLYALCWR